MVRALAHFTELQPLAAEFAPLWADLSASGCIETDELCLRVISGDARSALPEWQEQANCWFLDGFSPAKNPELWGADLLESEISTEPPTEPASIESLVASDEEAA